MPLSTALYSDVVARIVKDRQSVHICIGDQGTGDLYRKDDVSLAFGFERVHHVGRGMGCRRTLVFVLVLVLVTTNRNTQGKEFRCIDRPSFVRIDWAAVSLYMTWNDELGAP